MSDTTQKSDIDTYGFPKSEPLITVYDSSNMQSSQNTNWKHILFITLLIIVIIAWVIMMAISGIYAYNEYPNVALWLKVIRVLTGVLLAPFYMLYIFVKIMMFKK